MVRGGEGLKLVEICIALRAVSPTWSVGRSVGRSVGGVARPRGMLTLRSQLRSFEPRGLCMYTSALTAGSSATLSVRRADDFIMTEIVEWDVMVIGRDGGQARAGRVGWYGRARGNASYMRGRVVSW